MFLKTAFLLLVFLTGCTAGPQVTPEAPPTHTATITVHPLVAPPIPASPTETQMLPVIPSPTHTSTPAWTPTPTVDTIATTIVETLLATVQPRTLAVFVSPDNQWRAEVQVYDCTKIAVGEGYESAYDLLNVIHLSDQQIHTAANQLQNCGGVGAAGLGGITWSPNSRYFYYTNAREGVPDGSGGFGWARPLFRFDTTMLQTEYLGGGFFSPDQQKIAAVSCDPFVDLPSDPSANCRRLALVVWSLDGVIQTHYPVEYTPQASHIVWKTTGNELVYLETPCDQNVCSTSLYKINLITGERIALVTAHQPYFVEAAWPEPDRLVLTDENVQTWYYTFSTKTLAAIPE